MCKNSKKCKKILLFDLVWPSYVQFGEWWDCRIQVKDQGVIEGGISPSDE
jgi:hypothetical protein